MPAVIGPWEGPVTNEGHVATRGGRGATLRGLGAAEQGGGVRWVVHAAHLSALLNLGSKAKV